jgi:hypothetical protein
MVSVTTDSQKSVFAQITPASEKFGSNDDATDSSHDIGTGNDNPPGITPSEKTDNAPEETTDSTDSNDVNSEQTITTEEQDPDPTNQLVEAIMNEVNEALSASGIFRP